MAANANGAPSGDNVYTTTLALPELAGSNRVTGTQTNGNFLRVYPNPANVASRLQVAVAQPGAYQLDVIGVDGRIFISENLVLQAGEQTLAWNFAQLPAGQYFFRLSGNATQMLFPVVRTRD
jgi:class 3 adenylate cyclase